MRRKLITGGGLLGLLLILCLNRTALATGINVELKGGAGSGVGRDHNGVLLQTTSVVQYLDGGKFAPDWNNITRNQFRRFNVGEGMAGADGKFAVNDATRTSTVFLRIWENSGPPAGVSDKKWYGVVTTGINAATGATEGLAGSSSSSPTPNEYKLQDFSTDYYTDVPNRPSLSGIAEELSRSGDNYNLTLRFSVNYSESGALSGKREIAAVSPSGTLFRVQINKVSPNPTNFPAEDAAADNIWTFDTNGSVTLNNATYHTPGTYYIRARAFNYWGASDWFYAPPYTTLSGGGGPMTEVFNLTKARGMGLNTIYVPFNVSGMTPAVTNWDQLIRAINEQAIVPGTTTRGYNTVQVIGRYVPSEQKWMGYIVTYGSSRLNYISSFTPINTTAQPSELSVSRQDVFWVSVLEGTDFTISGTR